MTSNKLLPMIPPSTPQRRYSKVYKFEESSYKSHELLTLPKVSKTISSETPTTPSLFKN